MYLSFQNWNRPISEVQDRTILRFINRWSQDVRFTKNYFMSLSYVGFYKRISSVSKKG